MRDAAGARAGRRLAGAPRRAAGARCLGARRAHRRRRRRRRLLRRVRLAPGRASAPTSRSPGRWAAPRWTSAPKATQRGGLGRRRGPRRRRRRGAVRAVLRAGPARCRSCRCATGSSARRRPACRTRRPSARTGGSRRLSQSGWQVRYDRYEPVGELALPARMELTTAGLRLRVVVSDWRLPP